MQVLKKLPILLLRQLLTLLAIRLLKLTLKVIQALL